VPETLVVHTGELVESQQWGDVDVQIATAKRYPRSIKSFIERATTMATITPDVAKSCFYALPRKEQGVQKRSRAVGRVSRDRGLRLDISVSHGGRGCAVRHLARQPWDLEANVAIA
jgi:hypothetical protein